MKANLPSRLDAALIEDAAKALIKYEIKRSQERDATMLIDGRPKWVLVQVQLQKEVPLDTRKPIKVSIPHTLFSTALDHSICLFVRDDQLEEVNSFLESHPIEGLDKVMSMGQVRKYCKEYKDRKALLGQHDFFLCHHSIGRQLYNLLGKDFGARNHFPVQINFPKTTKLASAVQQAVDATYMHLSGRNMTIRVGLTSMSPQTIRENIVQGMESAVQKLKNGWRDVHSLHLKTKDSASLPMYSATDNELLSYVKSKAQEKASATATTTTTTTTAGSSSKTKKTTATAESTPRAALPQSAKKKAKA